MLTHGKHPVPYLLFVILLGIILILFLQKQPADAAEPMKEQEDLILEDLPNEPNAANPLPDSGTLLIPGYTKQNTGSKSADSNNQESQSFDQTLSDTPSGDETIADSANADSANTDSINTDSANADSANADSQMTLPDASIADADLIGKEVSLHVYFNFYDSSTGDIDHTIGLYSMEVIGHISGDYIEGLINPAPGMFDFQEVDGFPQVLLNYGDVSGREVNISDECIYHADSGYIQIPIQYHTEYLTVKCIMSERSMAYQRMIPDAYKVIKTSAPMLRAPATDTSQFEVLSGSSNDVLVYDSTDPYKTGDVIPISKAYIQTLNRNENSSLYSQTGTSAYMGYKGESIGYAISFTCDSAPLFSNIGSPGGSFTSRFPMAYNSYVTIPFSDRNWIYARCITTDSNYFDGNPKFSSGKITITNKSANGTLTCWVELYLTGPKNENAQNVGMYFQITPQKLPDLTITKRKFLTFTNLSGAQFSLWAYDGTSYSKKLGNFTDNQDGTYTFSNIDASVSYENRFLIKEDSAPPGYQLPYVQTNSADKADFATYGGRPVQYINGSWTGSFTAFHTFQDKLKPNVTLTIHKKISVKDVYWSHGIPTFFFRVQGTDEFGKSHTWVRSIVFTPQYISYASNPDGTVQNSVVLKDLPPGTYNVRELPVSRYVLTSITAQTSNISVFKVNSKSSYEGITPITGFARAKLTDADGEVTFENRKITWDKYSHNNIVINQFSLANS